MEKEEQIDIQSIINQNNPWRDPTNKDWAINDGALRDVKKAESEGLYHPPKFYYYLREKFFDRLFANPTESGVLIVRGPRRIGKTSTLKYIIEQMIEGGYSRESFIYLSLDQDEFFLEVNKKRRLREVLSEIIKTYKKKEQPLILVLDEVTFYLGWARVLKNLVDEGLIGEGVAIIATGSYSLDLGSAKREMSGRFGKLGESCGEDLLFSPRRFNEVAESILGTSGNFRQFLAKNIGQMPKKTGLLEYLAGFQNEEKAEAFGYKEMINTLLEKYYPDLHNLLFENYLFAGGYPRKIYQIIISTRNGKVEVPDKRYTSDIYDLIVSDAKKFNLDEKIISRMLANFSLPSMRVGEDLKLFCELGTDTRISKDECNKYLEYLSSSGLFSLIPCISKPEQIDSKTKLITPSTSKYKLLITDPAVFFALYFGSRGIGNIFERARKIVTEEKTIKEFLFESIVVSHLLHHPRLKKDGTKNISFILESNGKEEGEELADGFLWYLNFEDEFITIAVEAKFSESEIDMRQIKSRAKTLKEKYGVKRLIVVTNKKDFEITDDYVIVPAEIFLLLF